MSRVTRAVGVGVGVIGGTLAAGVGGTVVRFYLDRRASLEEYRQADAGPPVDLGSVDRLSVLPLVDWYTAAPELAGESGISYLVRAGDTTILFDTGYNSAGDHPSPLLNNMRFLGVRPDEVDMVVISHAHADHTGGRDAASEGTFRISPKGNGFRDVPAYTPEPLDRPDVHAKTVRAPEVLAPGVATTGTIPRALWLMGLTREQALVVDVAGKGLVIIAGCGHQGLERLLERVHAISAAPIYGFIGGLHLPITESRMPGGRQRLMGTGRLPWRPLTKDDARDAAERLAAEEPQLVALSPHDSCDWSLDLFRETFGPAYEPVLVGEQILVA